MDSSRSTARTVSWIVAILLMGGLGAVCWQQQKTLTALRGQVREQQTKLAELDRLREENKAAQGLQDQQAEIERLRENTRDLVRLRNEVTQLRSQLQELEVLRSANAQLLQAVQGAGVMQSNQLAMLSAARRMGSILGVIVRTPTSGQQGVEVTGIDPTSPIAATGIAVGDVILSLNGQRVLWPGELQARMLTHKPGETVVVDVLRTNAVFRLQTQTRPWPQ